MKRLILKCILTPLLILLISDILVILIITFKSSSPYRNKLPIWQFAESLKGQHKLQDTSEPVPKTHKQSPFLDKHQLPPIEQQHHPIVAPNKINQEQFFPISDLKKDWHDYNALELDTKRIGIGEQGKRASLDDESLKTLEQKMSLQNGFNALLSDAISVNRSVPDIRYEGCRTKRYLARLPTVSIVMPFFDEHFSVLVRSIHSLVNRSPPELLKEIILVDDNSEREYLFAQLDQYVAENFPKVQIMRLRERYGLIGARLFGARKASGEVLIFLDSHIEANYNWLPPLLEPIALDKRTAVCPFIDVIDHTNFEYRPQDNGKRGAFDWEFYYKRLPLLPEDLLDRTKPFKNPIMAGGLFAISAEFFWELGGYDEGLDIWGGEQYELSFKIWICGGVLLDAPCSHIAHIFRGRRKGKPSPRKGDYLHKNYKRVAEVWMDEYKNYLYQHGKGVYERIDTGDISKQKALREKLNCKSFRWFMENVAFDLTKTYPLVEPPDYASGGIQTMCHPTLCMDTLTDPRNSPIGLNICSKSLKKPNRNQDWVLSWNRDLRLRRKWACFIVSVPESTPNATVWLWDCEKQDGNQVWYYDRVKKWLVYGRNGKRCLEAIPEEWKIYVNECDKDNENMKWEIGKINATALSLYNDEMPEFR